LRILINGTNYHPEKIGIGKYTGEMAEWLASRGHEVRVVTAPPYYPEWKIGQGYSAWCYKREIMVGVAVWRCPLWVPKKLSGLKRVLHLASFALSCLPVMLRQVFWKPDVVLVIEPPLMCAPIAWLTAKLCGAKSWLHIQDFEVDAAFDMGMLQSPSMRRFALWCESQLMRSFDRISTISPRMLEKVIGKSIAPSKTYLFQNWVDTSSIFPMESGSSFRAELGISGDKVVALYSGNMGEKQGLEVVVDAARRMANVSAVQFVLCGDGAAKVRLQEYAVGLSNVIWIPLQPTERLNELLNLADVHLLPQRADVADLLMPSKLLGMLASARPILATALPDTQVGQLVAICGVLSPPGNAEAFSVALQKLSDDATNRNLLGKKGREIVVSKFGYNSVLTYFEYELNYLAEIAS